MGTILVTGATGFVGSRLHSALSHADHDIRCGTRNVDAARLRDPARVWVHCDVSDPVSLAAALSGCRTAYYLVHEISGARDYPEREASAAHRFVEAAQAAGVERVVYLGGVAPTGPASRHLASRLETGRILRSGSVDTVELRAAMIIGAGSASWSIVRDLAARLPAMVLPKWLLYRSSPVAVGDVIRGLIAAADSSVPPGVYDVAGPELVTHRDLLVRVAGMLGKHPLLVHVPVLTPHLSSYWIALVTRADLDLARELVSGLQSDLLPDPQRHLWNWVPTDLTPLDRACSIALVEEASWATAPAPHGVPNQSSRSRSAR